MEDKRKVNFVMANGEVKKDVPIKEAVVMEVTMKGTIEGGRPLFEEVPEVKKATATTTSKTADKDIYVKK